METIRVNMTPCEDVQTIHASQNDNEAREWGFELHNNGDVIDASEITDQMVFKAYEGGTEQILPENGSVPVTTPFLGDIRYPQGLLTDQEFTYRQSPTEEDGLAFIEKIKGNTLVWNQLVPTTWASSGSGNGVTFTNNGDGSYTFNGTSTGTTFIPRSITITAKANHKYFVNVGNNSNTGLNITINGLGEESYVKTKAIISSTIDNNFVLFYLSGASFNNLKVWPQIIDLTQMGLDSITSVGEFTSLFSKTYYDYCQGAMLSFGGRNVKFNQLVQNGNFVDTSVWNTTFGVSFTVSGNVATVTSTDSYGRIRQFINFVSGHKYLIFAEVKKSNADDALRLYYGTQLGGGSYIFENNTNWQKLAIIKTATSSESSEYPNVEPTTSNITWQQRNMRIIDLTEMFGAGNEPTVNGFKELFPNDYYEYNVGQYMNLGQPVELKTVGFNQWDEEWEVGTLDDSTGANKVSTGSIRSVNYIQVLPDTVYYIYVGKGSNMRMLFYDGGMNYLGVVINANNGTFTTPANARYMRFRSYVEYGTTYLNDICINISNTELNGTYKPYTSSTLSLPISTYFPNGMKSAGTVYDEKTPNKATIRLKEVTFSSVSAFDSSGKLGLLGDVTDAVNITRGAEVPNDKSVFETYSLSGLRNNDVNGITQFGKTLYVRLQGKTTLEEYNAYLSSNPLSVIYKLATPIETLFTTASLVTENGEIPLTNEDGVLIGKCTEQLSSESGFFDAKIKLADGDGDVYSNKIQLHIERSPQ